MEDRIGATEKELQRLPALEKTVEGLAKEMRERHKELKAILEQMQEGRSRVSSLPTVTISTGKMKIQVEDEENEEDDDPPDEMEEGETLTVTRGEQRERIKLKKLEMPIFNGSDPDDGMFRAEMYFQLHKLTEEEKLTVAIISLEGRANKWYRWSENRRKFRSWANLKRRIFKKFLPTQQGSLCARFLAIKQETTVEEYCDRFVE